MSRFFHDYIDQTVFEEEKRRVIDEFKNFSNQELVEWVMLREFGNVCSTTEEDIKRTSMEDVKKFIRRERDYRGLVYCRGPPRIVDELLDFGKEVFRRVWCWEQIFRDTFNYSKKKRNRY